MKWSIAAALALLCTGPGALGSVAVKLPTKCTSMIFTDAVDFEKYGFSEAISTTL